MAGSDIIVFKGRAKAFALQWRQGGQSGSPIDCTGATFEVIRSGLTWPPTINVINAAQGRFELIFGEDCCRDLNPSSAPRPVTLALTLAGPNAAYSPDPITLQVFVK